MADETTPKGAFGVSFGDYVDMSPSEREEFHKRHFRTAARFERAMLNGDGGGGGSGKAHEGLATLLVVGVLAGGAFLLWRAAKSSGKPIWTGNPMDFLKQGPVLAGVVGGGVGAAAGMLTGASPAKLAMLGAGIGVVGSALNPRGPGAVESVKGLFVSGPSSSDIFRAQLRLGQLGYGIPADGKVTPAMTAALKQFQATYSLQTTDGSLSQETLSYLDQVAHQTTTAPDPTTGLHPQLPSWA